VSARALVGVYVLGASDKPLGRIAAISQTPDRAPFARIVMMDLTSKDVIGIWEMTKVQLHARRINKVSGVSGGVVTNLNISDLNWSKRSSEDQKYQARITSQSSREILKQIGVSLADLP
jgi:hypothetical protein